MFHGTHIPLKNWFLVLALMLHAKKSASAYQVARDLGMRRPTVWGMMHKVRIVMAGDPAQNALLHGIVEADETYIDRVPLRGVGAHDARDLRQGWPECQAGTAGNLTMGSSLKGAMVSSVMYRPR
jgi:hypothetical protein